MTGTPGAADYERYYHRIGAGDFAPAQPPAVRCPACDNAATIDPPQWDCEHCGETLELFVGALATCQTPETDADCHEATGGEQ